jgi:IMP dehydrogenase
LPPSFVTKLKNASQAYTFRDFILLPGRSEVEPRDIDLSSNLTKHIKLSLPFVSSPMDTVTEWRMAAELARIGAVGVIHRNMSIDSQVEQEDGRREGEAPRGRVRLAA